MTYHSKTDSMDDIVFHVYKSLRQYIIEQGEDLSIVEDTRVGEYVFSCGAERGLVSPQVVERILGSKKCKMDDFCFAIVSRKGGQPQPCILLAGHTTQQARPSAATTTYESIYRNLLASIKENYKIKTLYDFDMFDAMFLLEALPDLTIEPGKTLGLYRRQDDIVDRSFIASPYIHNHNADRSFEPVITPIKPTLAQRLGVAKQPYEEGSVSISHYYSPEYLINNVVDRRIAKLISMPSQHILLPNKREAFWQLFLLDNIEYFLPKFDHGAYLTLSIIFSTTDIDSAIRYQAIANLPDIDYTPKVSIKGDIVTITCIYFNQWKGLVRWSSSYRIVPHNSLVQLTLLPASICNTILIKYDCGIRI